MLPAKLIDGNIARMFRAFAGVIAIGASLSALGCVTPAAAQTPANVTGVWFDTEQEGGIEIAPCGNRMCGRIVWLKNPLNAEGKPLFDRHNPDTKLQPRPICGLQILRDLQPLTDGSWGRGVVYDPKKGAENEASIKPLSGGKLQLTGYGLFGLSKSFEWTRAPTDIQRCGALATQTGATPPAPANAVKPIATTAQPVPAAKPVSIAKPASTAAGMTGAYPAATAKPAPPVTTAPQTSIDAKKSTFVPKPQSEAAVPKAAAKAAIVAPLVSPPPVMTTSKAATKPAVATTQAASATTKATATAQKKSPSVMSASTGAAKTSPSAASKATLANTTAKPAAGAVSKNATATAATAVKKKTVAKAAIPADGTTATNASVQAGPATAASSPSAVSAEPSPAQSSSPSSATGFADGQ